MKKLSILIIVLLLFLTGCSYFEEVLRQDGNEAENKTTEIVSFFTFNFSVHNVYNEKDNL